MPARVTRQNRHEHRDPFGTVARVGLGGPAGEEWPLDAGFTWRHVATFAVQKCSEANLPVPELRAGDSGRVLLTERQADGGTFARVEDTPYYIRTSEMNATAYLHVFFALCPDGWIEYEPRGRKHRQKPDPNDEGGSPFFER